MFRHCFIGWGCFVTVPFFLLLVPDSLYAICAIFSIDESLLTFLILLLKHLVTQILYQGSINYFLFITSKCEKKRRKSALYFLFRQLNDVDDMFSAERFRTNFVIKTSFL